MRKMNAQIEFSRKQLLHRVSIETQYRDVNPKSFYRWLKDLGFIAPPYDLSHLQAVTYYADRLALGIKAAAAKQLTIEYLESHHDNRS
jgi:hypothetical protein